MSEDDKPLTLGAMRLIMSQHEEFEAARLKEKYDAIMSAFPDSDGQAHREYHQELINAAKEQKIFWQTAQARLIERGIDGMFGVLKIVLMLALAGAAVKFGIALPFVGGDK